ncbi:fucose-binding lectin II [Paraburkholderia phenazinium]|jgi:hypothetical protein|uniref:Fucose-binding lectin II (PA-IIL) n=1 Tax=Paraburkholderia phenazinium TaxID=60549 RepID=A0A1G8FIW7_9BURK|nr:fucose-binding lectin II [Paraburkholderia phenazinium]SDH82058.1 Fucose-binding lectin II (PA-IIL) [Paraburkholderia phenazinium]
MADDGVFRIPAGIEFGATVLVNSALAQTVKVLVDGEVRATFDGSGIKDKNLGTQVIHSGRGEVRVKVEAGGKPSELLANTISEKNLNVIVIGSEDGSDYDYNDSIVVLNWPLG